MRTSTIATLLFGSLALAAPLDKRRYLTATHTVIATEIIYVTEYAGQGPVAEATSTPGLFYEQHSKHTPKASSTSAAAATSTSTSEKAPASQYTPPAAPEPTSTSTQAPAPEPTSVYSPPASSSAYTPAPAPEPTTSAYVAPAPAPSSTAPTAPAPSSPSGGGNGNSGDMTMYNTEGGYGACGTTLSDNEMTAAISKDSWGADIWGGADNLNQNPWCGKSATVTYGGKSITVKIMDKCQGCVPGDIDLTPAAWNQLTDNAYPSRVKATWTSS